MRTVLWAAALAAGIGGQAIAADPAGLMAGYRVQAQKADPAFSPSAARGGEFFSRRHGGEWSCASCHGSPATGQGKHARTGKAIAPLAPSANAERFTDAAKVEKWFRRNCNDVLSRACSPAEKADVLAWLLKGEPK